MYRCYDDVNELDYYTLIIFYNNLINLKKIYFKVQYFQKQLNWFHEMQPQLATDIGVIIATPLLLRKGLKITGGKNGVKDTRKTNQQSSRR